MEASELSLLAELPPVLPPLIHNLTCDLGPAWFSGREKVTLFLKGIMPIYFVSCSKDVSPTILVA